MTLTAERPWKKAKRFFESNFKGETFAESLLKNLDGGLVYSDGQCFVLAQEAGTDGLHLDFSAQKKNAWYVQLAVGSGRRVLSKIMAALNPSKEFVCFKRGAKSNRLKCYQWNRLAGKVGL
jgi:hypothetical protein